MKGLKKNLLSIRQLDDLGLKTEVENGTMKVVKGALIVMKAETSKPFILQGDTLKYGDAFVASINQGESIIKWPKKIRPHVETWFKDSHGTYSFNRTHIGKLNIL